MSATTSLEGRVAVVTGAEAVVGLALVRALAGAGAAIGILGHVDHGVIAELGAIGVPMVVAPTDLSSRDEVADAVAFAADRLGPPDILVHTAVDPVAFEPRPLAAVDDAHFEAVWEATMEATLWCLQAGYAHMAGRGGRILLTIPTIAMSGAPGLVPYAAAAEGQRLLAKSAARQWGAEAITVNCLAIAPELLGVGVVGLSLAGPALAAPFEPEHDLGPVAVFLAGDGAHAVTGATVCVDGGVWMAP